jgi:hypothetical protein
VPAEMPPPDKLTYNSLVNYIALPVNCRFSGSELPPQRFGGENHNPPVVGSFEENIGRFFCKDIFNDKPILVVFVWDKTDKDNPVWSQAFWFDNGLTWEWNLTNTSHKIK